MLKDKEYSQTEELSQKLDSLNDGKYPVIQNEEIKELIEVATLVKQSFNQGDLPRSLINEMTGILAAELGKQKEKRRMHWLYGGLVGTAAAVLIAAFSQFLLPQSTDHHIAQQMDDSREMPKLVASADQSSSINVEIPIAIVSQQVESDNRTEIPIPAPIKEKSGESVSKVIEEIIDSRESSKIDQNSNQVAILQQEEASNDIATRKSAPLEGIGNKSLRANKNIHPERNIAMVMPNQAAQSVTVDSIHGVIQQVYNQGSDDEIIITQRPLNGSRVKFGYGVKQSEVQASPEGSELQHTTKDTKDMINSLTVKVDKYEVTIEGKKTTADLKKIAESLTAKEIEQ